MSIAARIRIHSVETLSHDWGVLKKTTFEYRRNDGSWQKQSRETYDRGNAATILLYNLAQRTVILIRQLRYPAYVMGHDALLLETPAGLLDDATPETRIRAETEEETGYRLREPRKVFEAFMSPGSVTEKLTFYVAAYEPKDKVSAGGGIAEEGEDIDTLEVPFSDAMAMIADGRILDAKTIMLLQHAALTVFR